MQLNSFLSLELSEGTVSYLMNQHAATEGRLSGQSPVRAGSVAGSPVRTQGQLHNRNLAGSERCMSVSCYLWRRGEESPQTPREAHPFVCIWEALTSNTTWHSIILHLLG